MPGQSTKDDPAYNAVGMDGEENPPCIGGYKTLPCATLAFIGDPKGEQLGPDVPSTEQKEAG